MFQDIIKLTKLTLENALEDDTIKLDLKALYDAYRAIERVIYPMHILEVHYLHLPFDAPWLQDSQHGSPFNKWYLFTEQDFDRVRKNMRAFLLSLYHLTYCKNDMEDECTSIVEKFYGLKSIFGFFSHYYESGKLSNDGLSVVYTKLILDKNNYYEDACIDIDTHEKRIELCKEIKDSVGEMQKIFDKTKAFLIAHATLEDLL